MNLSICLIVKNEEKNLPRCLNSIKDLAYEIIVVDTGSKDKTKEIALGYGCVVIDFIWCNDFSKARNLSLDNATGDWILFLDADEEMPREDLKKLINMMENEKKAEAYFLKMVNFIKGHDIGNAIVLRAFRNRKEYRFIGKLHEQIINSIEERVGNDAIVPTQIKIFHYGYDPDLVDTSIKSKRNLEILLDYPEDKKDGYYYYSLGNEYARIKKYEQALEIYNKSIKITDYKEKKYIYFPYLIVNLMKAYTSMEKYNSVIEVLERYQIFLPDFKDMYFLGAIACIKIGKNSLGKYYMDKYILSDNGSYEYPNNNYDKMYDVNNILKQLNEKIINKSKLLIGCAFVVENKKDNVEQAIKNINELCDEVIIFDLNSENETIKECLNLGAKIVKCNKSDLEKNILKHIKTKWILELKGNEIFSGGQQEFLVNILEDKQIKCNFNVEILDLKTNTLKIEKRLFLQEVFKDKNCGVRDIGIMIYKNYL